MATLFKFRMLSDENDNFLRDYELLSTSTLLDLHNFILTSLEYEDCIASFFTADAQWEKGQEFTLMSMGEESQSLTMQGVTLEQVLAEKRDRLIYLFDMFGDRAYYLELVDITSADDSADYPREAYAQADAPDQYDASKSSESDDGSIFDDIMGEFNDFEGDESYNDEY